VPLVVSVLQEAQHARSENISGVIAPVQTSSASTRDHTGHRRDDLVLNVRSGDPASARIIRRVRTANARAYCP
jgi:hypothetical protein